MAYLIMRVARSTALPFDVVDAWPWSAVLRHGMALDEVERVEAIRGDLAQAELAIRVGAAMSGAEGAQELGRVRRAIKERGRLTIRDREAMAVEDQGRRMMAKLDRIARRRRRRGTV
jgi:hypothetical protein